MAILEVYNLDESMVMLALKHKLPTSDLISLDKIPVKSYLEMLVHAHKYFYEEEGTISPCEVDERPNKKAREEPSRALTSKPDLSHR